ncbi:MAG: Asp23/Gls24 family envelope stress response protein [Atopobiaceae bacterium]
MDKDTKAQDKAAYTAPEGQESMTDTEDIVAAEEDDNSEDSLTFSNGVIEKIVALAVRDVPGVVGMKGGWVNRVQDALGATDPRKGVTVEVTPDAAVRVNISVLIEYGAYAPQIFEDVKKAVVKQVMGMTGLEVAGVNLRIEDVLTPEEVSRNAKRQAEEEAEEEAGTAAESEAEATEAEEAETPAAAAEPKEA